jgi:hypothetical protein
MKNSLAGSRASLIIRATSAIDENFQNSIVKEYLSNHPHREGLPEASTELPDAHFAQFKKMNEELARDIKPFSVVVNPGDRIVSPPYDVQWGTGGGVLYSVGDQARTTGELGVVASTEGFSACGVGIALQSTVPLAAAITPAGTYQYSQLTSQHDNNTVNAGGVDMLAYVNGDANPVVRSDALLWNLNGTNSLFPPNGPIGAASGSGNIADAVVTNTVFGPIRLAPMLFDMQPGSSYVVWIWVWSNYKKGDASLFSLLLGHLPSITVSAGPPIIIH